MKKLKEREMWNRHLQIRRGMFEEEEKVICADP
jgi:hypothetical protein